MSDLNLYFSNTINFVDGKLCYIHREVKDGLLCRPLKGGKTFISKNVTPINNIKLGYVNTPLGAIFLKRLPVRSAKDGINSESTMSTSMEYVWDNFPSEFEDMINDVYPTKDEALKLAKEKKTLVAYSKYEAVYSDGCVIYGVVESKRGKRYEKSQLV